MTANIVLQTSKVLALGLDSSEAQSYLPRCKLKWRQKNLWVKSFPSNADYSFPALTRKQWLESCLRNSLVKRVCVDRQLGEQGIKLWADTCQQAGKPIFIRLNSYSKLSNCHQTIYWKLKRVGDLFAALMLLIVSAPLILAVAILIKIFAPGPIFFSQWRIGERGKLFKIYKFRTMTVDAEPQHCKVMENQKGLHKEQDLRITFLGKWLRKYGLDEIPQIFNVLRGEMSLVGPRPWALYDGLRLDKTDKKRLNALPGMTGAWQIQSRSNLLDLNAVTKCDMDYLYEWSLVKDIKILLLTIPKVLSGFGAY